MRWTAVAALLFLCAVPAHAAEPRCPLDLTACLEQFGHMRDRPWMGVSIEVDSTGRRMIREVTPGSPAQRAGVRPGDELRQIDGQTPADWFAGKAGWKYDTRAPLAVVRGSRALTL